MRLLKIGVYYPAYLKSFYAQRPALAAQASAIQHEALMADCFGSSDFWTSALRERGYQTGDITANAEPLQKCWAQEQNLTYNETDWLFEITLAQIKAFRPDVLLIADYSTLTAQFLRQVKRECPFVRLVLGWCGAPYRDPSVFREWDVVLSCIPELVARFRADGHRSRHINHAFAPRILQQIDTTAEPTADFAFLGSVVKSNEFHKEREKILLNLIEHTNLQIWSEATCPPPKERRRARLRRLTDDGVRIAHRLGVPQALLTNTPVIRKAIHRAQNSSAASYVDERICRRARPPLFGLKMFQQLHDSRIALNTHIDISPISASNMRLFEATGVGACLLTDWKANLAELFAPEQEVVTYRTPDECVEKAKYLLEHENERRKIAAAGQRRTLRDHTFAQRAAQIDEVIREALPK